MREIVRDALLVATGLAVVWALGIGGTKAPLEPYARPAAWSWK